VAQQRAYDQTAAGTLLDAGWALIDSGR